MKQVILVRTDLKMNKGKLASQCSHASVEAVLNSKKEKVEYWRKKGMKKVVLKVKDKEELLNYFKKAKSLKLTTALITDAGRTVFHNTSTTTCLAIGPDLEEKIDKITSKLKML